MRRASSAHDRRRVPADRRSTSTAPDDDRSLEPRRRPHDRRRSRSAHVRLQPPTATPRHARRRRWSSSAGSTRRRIPLPSRRSPSPSRRTRASRRTRPTPPDAGQLDRVHQPGPLPRPRAGPAPLRGARARPGRQRRPDAGDVRVGRSTSTAEDEDARPGLDRARHADRRRPRRRVDSSRRRPSASPAATTLTPGLQPDVRVPARRRRRRTCACTAQPAARTPASATGAAHVRGARDRPRRATSTRRRRSTRGRRSSPPADTTPPDTTIDSGPDPVTVQHQPRPSRFIQPTTRRATFECSLERAGARCLGRVHVAEGVHRARASATREFRVRAVDPAGNADPTPATYAWTVGAAPVPGTVVLRPDDHAEHQGHERPDRLPLGRPRGRRRRASRSTSTATPSTARASARASATTATTTSRSRTASVKEFDYGVMLNVGTERNIVEALTLEQQPGGRHRPRALPPRLDPNLPQPAGAAADVPVGGQRQHPARQRRHRQRPRHLADQRHAGHPDPRQLARAPTATRASGSSGRTATGSRTTRSAASSGAGVALQGSSDNTVARQHADRERRRRAASASPTAARVGLPSNDNRVEKNTILESGGAGDRGRSSRDGNQLLDNVAHFSNGDGISLYHARDTLVLGNDVRSNKGGISLKNSSDNRLEDNDASESEGTGIALADLSVEQHVLISNISSNNDGDGIYVGDETAGGSGIVDRGQHDEQQQGLRHLRAQGQPHDQGQHRQRQRRLGHLGQRGQQRPRQHRRRRQQGPGQPRPARPAHAQAAAVLQRSAATAVPAAATDPIAPDTSAPRGAGRPEQRPTSRAFRFNGSDNASTVDVPVLARRAAPFAPCVSPRESTRSPSASTRSRSARSTSSGNVDLTPATHTWLVDRRRRRASAPVATIDAGPGPHDRRDGRDVRVLRQTSAARRSSARSTARAFAPCTSPKAYTGLAGRRAHVPVRATDSAGNTDDGHVRRGRITAGARRRARWPAARSSSRASG